MLRVSCCTLGNVGVGGRPLDSGWNGVQRVHGLFAGRCRDKTTHLDPARQGRHRNPGAGEGCVSWQITFVLPCVNAQVDLRQFAFYYPEHRRGVTTGDCQCRLQVNKAKQNKTAKGKYKSRKGVGLSPTQGRGPVIVRLGLQKPLSTAAQCSICIRAPKTILCPLLFFQRQNPPPFPLRFSRLYIFIIIDPWMPQRRESALLL